MPNISISVRTISVALLLLASAVDIVAAPVSTAGPSQMPSTPHIERRGRKLLTKVFARRSPDKGDTVGFTTSNKYKLRPGETVNIGIDYIYLDVQRKKPNAPNSPGNSDSLNSPSSPNSPNSGHNFPKSEQWHVEPKRNNLQKEDPRMLFLGQIEFFELEGKISLVGRDVFRPEPRGIWGSLFTEVIESENSISPGPLESHETANLLIEKLRRWSNDPQVRMKFEEEEVEHPETKEKIKVWDAYFQSTKTLKSIARWDTSKLLELVPYPGVDKLELDWDTIAKEVEARLKAQYGDVKYEHE